VLIRNSVHYGLAIGLPGLMNFAGLMLFTHLLAAAEFGQYALALAGLNLAHVLGFQWLQMVVARFLPTTSGDPQRVIRNVFAIFLALGLVVMIVGVSAALFWQDSSWQLLIALAVPLALVQAWMQLNLTLASTQLAPSRYGQLLGAKSLVAVSLGGYLAWSGWGASAPLLGLLGGGVLASLMFGRTPWIGIHPRCPTRPELTEYVSYGLPLTITFVLGWVISASDRVLLAWLDSETATGVYAAGYDLAQQSLGLLLSIVNTAAYPLLMRKMALEGEYAASHQIQRNGELIFTVALCGAAGLIALAPALTASVLGPAFQTDARQVLPWIAVAAAVSGIKAFHFDVAFQLAKQSKWQVYTGVIAAVVNIVACIVLIPLYGMVGAAWAALIAHTAAAICSYRLGKRVFAMPPVMKQLGRATAVAGFTYLGARWATLCDLPPISQLLVGIATGALTGLIASVLMNIAGLRQLFWAETRTN
jgi:O-antigen/teichoic acid export membrane protein